LPSPTTELTYQVNIYFAISSNIVVNMAPLKELKKLTLVFGINIYSIVTTRKTRTKGTMKRIINWVIFPILNPGKKGESAFRRGTIDVAANDNISKAMIKVTTDSEINTDKIKCLFVLTLKMALRAAS